MFSEEAQIESDSECGVLKMLGPQKEEKNAGFIRVTFEEELLKLHSGLSEKEDEIGSADIKLEGRDSIKNLFFKSPSFTIPQNMLKGIEIDQIEQDEDLSELEDDSKIEK